MSEVKNLDVAIIGIGRPKLKNLEHSAYIRFVHISYVYVEGQIVYEGGLLNLRLVSSSNSPYSTRA